MLNILIIDDDTEILESLKKGLERIGHKCTIVNSAVKALKIYKNNDFDVVLTDIQMPKMDGVELIQNLYQYDKEVKVIVITVIQDFEFVGSKILDNVYAYFDKPINLFNLIEKLEEIENGIKV